jgi:phosphoglycolate phosphatase
MPEIRNVILDWSGTLADDLGPVLEATNEIFRHYQKPVWSLDEFREKFYLPFPKFYAEHLPELVLADLDERYHASFQVLQNGIILLPHALDFLEYLRSRELPTFLLSSIHSEHFEAQGGRLGVKDYFTRVYTQALDKRKVILHLLAEHELDASETIFIGDMVHDIETARHAGVMSCAVLTGYDSLEKLKSANPDLLFRNLGEVQTFLERHRGIPTHPPVPTVGALIFNAQGEVLMIQTHKWSHRWGIPGGKIKTNEPSLDALRREVKEETGLELKNIRFELVQDCIEPPEFYKKAHFLLMNYTAEALGTDVVLNDEAETYRWVSLDEVGKMDLNGPTRILLEHARSHPHR